MNGSSNNVIKQYSKMSILILSFDLLKYLLSFIRNKDKIHFVMSSKKLYWSEKFTFDEKIWIKNIVKHSHLALFTNIIFVNYDESCKNIPQTITKLTIFFKECIDTEYLSKINLTELVVEIDEINFHLISQMISPTVRKLKVRVKYSKKDIINIDLNSLNQTKIVQLTIIKSSSDCSQDTPINIIGKIPNSVTRCKFDCVSNLSHALHNNVKHLSIRSKLTFVKLIIPILPSLTCLDVGYGESCKELRYEIFNLHNFCPNLKYLFLGPVIINLIPPTVTDLKLNQSVAFEINNNNFKNIRRLTISKMYEIIIPTILLNNRMIINYVDDVDLW